MEDIFNSELDTKKEAEIIQQCNEKIKAIYRIFDQMEKDEQEIDRLNSETRAMLNLMRKAA